MLGDIGHRGFTWTGRDRSISFTDCDFFSRQITRLNIWPSYDVVISNYDKTEDSLMRESVRFRGAVIIVVVDCKVNS